MNAAGRIDKNYVKLMQFKYDERVIKINRISAIENSHSCNEIVKIFSLLLIAKIQRNLILNFFLKTREILKVNKYCGGS